jgi:hypothetical protein
MSRASAILAAVAVIGGIDSGFASIRPNGSTAPAVRVVADTFPRFDRVRLLESTSETSANVSIGDVDGDGRLDIVLAKGRHWPLVDRVLLGDGAGGFGPPYDLGPVADRTYSGRLADVDRDGDLDVVISNDRPDPKRIYLNDGKGKFTPGSTYGRPEWPTRNATVADVDGDGYVDIVVANRGNNAVSNFICFNARDGRFDADCAAFSREPATTIAAADFNRDGSIDLAVPHRNGGQSRVYLAGPKGRFSDARTIPFGPPNAVIRMAEAADLDGDGLLDIVSIDERARTAIHFGQRNGGFSSRVPVGDPAITPYALAVGDVNGDGRADIIVGNVQAPSTIHFNDGSGRRFHVAQFGDNQGTVYGFALADLDRDGLVDIAVARSEAPNVVYFASRADAATRVPR